MFTHNTSALTPDLSPHGNTRLSVNTWEYKVTGVTYLKESFRYVLVNLKVMRYFKKVIRLRN